MVKAMDAKAVPLGSKYYVPIMPRGAGGRGWRTSWIFSYTLRRFGNQTWLTGTSPKYGGLIGTIIYWVDFREHFFLIEVERRAYCIPPCHTSTCADDVIQSPTDLISPYLTNESATGHHKLVAPKHRSQSVSDRSNLQHVFACGPNTDLAFLRFFCVVGVGGV